MNLARDHLATSNLRPIARSRPAAPVERYALGPLLGRGGMSKVYAAHDTVLDRDVALKIIDRDLPTATARLIHEARAMAAIYSRHVVAIYDLATVGETTALVMQRVRGATMREVVETAGPIECARAVRLILDVLAGVTALHAAGLLHRDIKSMNVMVDTSDRAVVLDLGIARHRRAAPLTPIGMVVGSIPHMAPEHRRGLPDTRSDLFQIALLFVYLVSGVELDPTATHAEAALTRLMPARLAAVAARGLARVERRFASAAEMIAAFEA